MNRNVICAFCLVLANSASSILAITISTVSVGNPGNSPDTRYLDSYHPNGVGAVAYSFNICTTEVTNTQYVAFLNAVAAYDPVYLYSPTMATDVHGGIIRSGTPGFYTYSIKPPALNGTYTYENKPVIGVGSDDAMRFANWLHNGQPKGFESPATTEDGAYTLKKALFPDVELVAIPRNNGALVASQRRRMVQGSILRSGDQSVFRLSNRLQYDSRQQLASKRLR